METVRIITWQRWQWQVDDGGALISVILWSIRRMHLVLKRVRLAEYVSSYRDL
jgi:hypothetical protein